jgi:two-component system, OmpR family, response regulator VanR
MRVLLVEDEVSLASALARGLRRNAIAVDVVHDGGEALRLTALRGYDVVVLDRDIPEVHGDEVCRRLRAQESESRVLMLTASDSLADRVAGLNLGADDYLGKPVRLMELLARIRALSRRRGTPEPEVIAWHGLRVDIGRRRAWEGERELELTPRELVLLEELIRAQGAPLSTDQLLARVFDDAHGDPTATTVRVLVMRLRRKLAAPELISTSPGHGYRLA